MPMSANSSSKEISEKLNIPLSTVTHYTNLGLFKVTGRRGNKRLYDEDRTRSQLAKIRKLTTEGYPLRLIRDKLLAAILLLLLAPSPGFAGEVGPDAGADAGAGVVLSMSLKDTIDTAIFNNKTVQIQEQEVEYARGNVLDARSIFYPQVGTSFGYTLNDAVFYSSQISPNYRKDTRIFSGYKDDNLFTLQANQTVYNGGANSANLMQARLTLKSQEETLRARKLDIEFEAKRLYFGLLLAYEIERVAKELLENTRAHYDDVKTKYGQGAVSKFDVLQSSVEVSKVIPDVVRTHNDTLLIMAELKKLLSISQQEDVRIIGRLEYSTIEITEEEFLKEAYRHRPEMILRLLGIDIQKWAIEYARAGYYPQVKASAGYTNRSNDIGNMFNSRHNNWSIGINANLAVFDGFSTKAKIDEARAKYSQANLEKEDVADQTAVDVKSDCLDMVKSEAIIKSQRDAIVEAKEALRIAEVGYDNGVTTNLDVLNTLVSLSDVQRNLSEGIYDYLMARAHLDRVRGREFSEFQEEKQ